MSPNIRQELFEQSVLAFAVSDRTSDSAVEGFSCRFMSFVSWRLRRLQGLIGIASQFVTRGEIPGASVAVGHADSYSRLDASACSTLLPCAQAERADLCSTVAYRSKTDSVNGYGATK